MYLPPSKVKARPGSLLVMPPHGRKSYYDGDPEAERYADYIASLQPLFSEIAVSITEGDYVEGSWWPAFKKRGISVLAGSDPFQRDPMSGVRDLLSRFEFVTSNSFGSHIAYAAFFGAKVSVAGSYAEFPRHELARACGPRMFPELVDVEAELISEASLRQHCPFLFLEPDHAECHRDWAGFELGVQHKRQPQELCALSEQDLREDG